MDSGSKILTFSLKNGENRSRTRLGSSPSSQSRKVQNKTFLGFYFRLKSCLSRYGGPYPPQCSRPGDNNLATAACTEPVSKFKNSKPPFHNTPSSHNTQKIPVHAKFSFGSSTRPNSIP
uniref:Uncharacterized protein n=1 Tax=Solanum tuberosum TaxID=4113 RepID=M1DN00_SOLTU